MADEIIHTQILKEVTLTGNIEVPVSINFFLCNSYFYLILIC